MEGQGDGGISILIDSLLTAKAAKRKKRKGHKVKNDDLKLTFTVYWIHRSLPTLRDQVNLRCFWNKSYYLKFHYSPFGDGGNKFQINELTNHQLTNPGNHNVCSSIQNINILFVETNKNTYF